MAIKCRLKRLETSLGGTKKFLSFWAVWGAVPEGFDPDRDLDPRHREMWHSMVTIPQWLEERGYPDAWPLWKLAASRRDMTSNVGPGSASRRRWMLENCLAMLIYAFIEAHHKTAATNGLRFQHATVHLSLALTSTRRDREGHRQAARSVTGLCRGRGVVDPHVDLVRRFTARAPCTLVTAFLRLRNSPGSGGRLRGWRTPMDRTGRPTS